MTDLAGGGGEYRLELDAAINGEDREDAERKAEIAHPVDDEGLDGGRVGLGLVVPEANQQIRSKADAFPAEKSCRKLSEVTSISMAKVKSER